MSAIFNIVYKIVSGYNADIICLQEVDCKIYDIDLTSVLRNIGYEGHFVKKTSAGEGLSCFYSSSRFKYGIFSFKS